MPDLQHCDHNLDSRDEQIQYLESGLSRNLQVCNRWLASQLNNKRPIPSIRVVKDCAEVIQQSLQMRVLLDLLQDRPMSDQLLNHPLLNLSSAPAPAAGNGAQTPSGGGSSGAKAASAAPAPPNRSALPAQIQVHPAKMKMALQLAQTAVQVADRTAVSARRSTRS